MTTVDGPLVSAVIPTYNYGHYVTEAVDSVLAQTYKNVEVIVVDDGSTDDTRDRLAVYGSRIRYIHQQNQGLSAARNTGIKAAGGPFVAFLDSDDLFHPRKLELQMRVFAARPELGLVATGQFSDEPATWAPAPDGPPPVQGLSLVDVVTRSRFAPSSVVARRECFEVVGQFDTTLRSVEDRDMWIRIADRFPLVVIPLPLTWYRVTPGSMSRNPQRMEYYEQVVLDRAFALPAVVGRRLLRRRARSLAAFAAAVMYREAGMYAPAVTRALRSLWLWPWPHETADLPRLARLKFLGLLPRSWGLRRRMS